MLNKLIFLPLADLIEIGHRHVVLEFELLDQDLEVVLVSLTLRDQSLNCSDLINELLIRCLQQSKSITELVLLMTELLDLLVQELHLCLRSVSLGSFDLSVHLLDLVLSIVKQLLLSLSFLLQIIDVCLQVSRGRETS